MLKSDRYRRAGDFPFRVRVILDDGREQTVSCWARDARHARTRSMMVVEFEPPLRGEVASYEVTDLSEPDRCEYFCEECGEGLEEDEVVAGKVYGHAACQPDAKEGGHDEVV